MIWVIRITSVKSSIGIITHQGHISQVSICWLTDSLTDWLTHSLTYITSWASCDAKKYNHPLLSNIWREHLNVNSRLIVHNHPTTALFHVHQVTYRHPDQMYESSKCTIEMSLPNGIWMSWLCTLLYPERKSWCVRWLTHIIVLSANHKSISIRGRGL